MNFIKKIFEGKADEIVHRQFIKFGKGDYERAYLNVKKGKELVVKSSFEFSNDFFEMIANNGNGEYEISGKIITNKDFENELGFEVLKYSKKGKVYTAEIKTKLDVKRIKEIYEKFKSNFLLLNVKGKNFVLKCGKNLPKPGGKVKDNFCSFSLPSEFKKEFVFEVEDFKKAQIKHTYIVEELIVPKEYKNNLVMARIEAKRKGKLKRIADIDGKIYEKEVNFLV